MQRVIYVHGASIGQGGGGRSALQLQKMGLVHPDKKLQAVKPVAVLAGPTHTVVVAACGTIYTWGLNRQFQLAVRGANADPEVVKQPTTLHSLLARRTKAVSVACGSYHTLLVDEYKKLWSWGSNARGQCGHGVASKSGEPRVASVNVAQTRHVGDDPLTSAEQWEAYVWQRAEVEASLQKRGGGSSDKSSEVLVVKDPRELRTAGGQTVLSAGAGHQHSCTVTSNGQMYSFGAGGHGQLMTGQLVDEHVPVRIRITTREEEEGADAEEEEGGQKDRGAGVEVQVRQVACGGGHTCFLSSRGEVYSAGFNARGQLGLGHCRSTAVPAHVDSVYFSSTDIAKVRCGDAFTAAVAKGGAVMFTWGWGGCGQLGYLPAHATAAATATATATATAVSEEAFLPAHAVSEEALGAPVDAIDTFAFFSNIPRRVAWRAATAAAAMSRADVVGEAIVDVSTN
jgi:alpha-tubulin suppressor-like RCC1 family protein